MPRLKSRHRWWGNGYRLLDYGKVWEGLITGEQEESHLLREQENSWKSVRLSRCHWETVLRIAKETLQGASDKDAVTECPLRRRVSGCAPWWLSTMAASTETHTGSRNRKTGHFLQCPSETFYSQHLKCQKTKEKWSEDPAPVSQARQWWVNLEVRSNPFITGTGAISLYGSSKSQHNSFSL